MAGSGNMGETTTGGGNSDLILAVHQHYLVLFTDTSLNPPKISVTGENSALHLAVEKTRLGWFRNSWEVAVNSGAWIPTQAGPSREMQIAWLVLERLIRDLACAKSSVQLVTCL